MTLIVHMVIEKMIIAKKTKLPTSATGKLKVNVIDKTVVIMFIAVIQTSQ